MSKDELQLEPEAKELVTQTANPPFLFDLGPEKGRAFLEELQSGPIAKPDLIVEDLSIDGGPTGHVSVRVMRPLHSRLAQPVILYIHGAGWVFGSAQTHDRLIRELAVRSQAAVVFPNYSLSPEAKYPVAIDECYAVAEWIAEHGQEWNLDPTRVAIAGDSVGGNMAAALTIMSQQRGGPTFERQLLFYPVTNADFETESYRQFATGHYLRRDAMMWFWDQYTSDPAERAEPTASPLRAALDDLRGLPAALIITAEGDVLRDEGEAYADRLRAAGVSVIAARFQGTIHDFVMLNSLAQTAAARGAMALATTWLRDGFANVLREPVREALVGESRQAP